VVAGLVAAGAVALAVRAGGSPAPAPDPPPVSEATSAQALPPTATPPYDRRPGRTPVPAPEQVGDQVSGALPAVGAPSKAAVSRAVDLVLGRYCDDPRDYTYTLDPDALAVGVPWRVVRALVFGLRDSGGLPVQQLTFTWTGAAYRWTGSLALVTRGC
jgi:hypothetical protein